MKAKERLYAVIGGCVGAVLTMVVCSFLPLGAQSQGEHVFGEITCTKLTVINAENRVIVSLGSNKFGAGVAYLNDRDGEIVNGLMLSAGGAGRISSFTPDHGAIFIHHNEHGGRVAVAGKNGGRAWIGGDEHGGTIAVYGNGSSKGQAGMGVNECGNGAVNTWDKNGYRLK